MFFWGRDDFDLFGGFVFRILGSVLGFCVLRCRFLFGGFCF